MNTLPATIRDPQFRGKALIDFLDKAQVSPDRIVIEITEKLVIDNYNLFRETMAYFTDLGMSFAVDDVGAGYSGLESIARLKPTYLKIDMLLVRDVHVSLVNREMVKAIIALGQRHRLRGHRGGHPHRRGSPGPERHGRRLGPGLPARPPRRRPRAVSRCKPRETRTIARGRQDECALSSRTSGAHAWTPRTAAADASATRCAEPQVDAAIGPSPRRESRDRDRREHGRALAGASGRDSASVA